MNQKALIERLKCRARSVLLRGKIVDDFDEGEKDPVGLFVPAERRASRRSGIYLKRGRGDQRTLFTLCHELGHFWAYATGRRTALYETALRRQQIWEDWIRDKIRNDPAVMAFGSPKQAPKAVYDQARAAAENRKPNPLSEEERREILDEESRAWALGLRLAEALDVDVQAFVEEANNALGWYYPRLKLDEEEWTASSYPLALEEDEEDFVRALTKADEQ